ncbi:hypothetical protein GF1_04970 [Desulfolithobacter dissulfuricans]|uniref:Uncharacterized protein n=1 Tax=Desulfolithobacter dissulfuricans TaxID=2795293 RepID=A0A915U8K9_9BACT|nr:hypothetical protein GF1_04970 [Desulfolithobacter dissulfuricans]
MITVTPPPDNGILAGPAARILVLWRSDGTGLRNAESPFAGMNGRKKVAGRTIQDRE